MTTIIRTISDLKAVLSDKKDIGLVPTMGALHEGHMSLVRLAKQKARHVVVSIFVNPTQFAPHEDFKQYPRPEAEDIELLTSAQTDIVFLPSPDEFYPKGYGTYVNPGMIATILEGTVRPHFFQGVATIVTKLLLLIQPSYALFGEKDYQQLHIIRQLVRDLHIPTTIIPAPIIREADGLAMSSRNRYLSPQERRIAPSLYRVLQETKTALRLNKPIADTLAQAMTDLHNTGFEGIDYYELRDGQTLAPLNHLTLDARLLAAVRLKNVRLIDTIAV